MHVVHAEHAASAFLGKYLVLLEILILIVIEKLHLKHRLPWPCMTINWKNKDFIICYSKLSQDLYSLYLHAG